VSNLNNYKEGDLQMSSILAGTLIILSAIIMTVAKRKIRVHRRIKANDRIIKEIVEKIERYEINNKKGE
tara:strand:+ start:346 stop:552 length:207 start_codon:yes stop_codon:yes gene_type:complete